jgi:tRNA pseudouridine55 synthase
VCVGQATRLIEYAQQLPKSYRGTFLLGRRSETDDVERDVEIVADAPIPTLVEVERVLSQFLGEVMQRPPRHSAVKIAGQRAYKLARKGVDFEPEPKTVIIHQITVARYDYPQLVLDVDCGSGTYIRSLGRDLAIALGTSAVMAALDRTAIGEFRAADATTLEQLDGDWESHVLPASRLVAGLPTVVVTPAEVGELQHGRTIVTNARLEGLQLDDDAEIAAFDADQNLIAILRQHESGALSPVRNFTRPD